MTVSSSTSRVSYNGNGSTTVFAYTFKVLDQDDLTVILRSSNGTETVQTLTTHYTVSGVGDAGGGNVTMLTAPASGETITILREQPLTQGLDLVPNDPFPAATLEDALDKLTFMVQTIDEEVGRSIKASRTNTISSTEFTVSASDRANKVFAFDSSGDIAVTQEIGTFTGNWAASTDYNQRDIIKDTSNNNIYICLTAHTSSGSQPINSNTDSAKWALIVDAASATTSATNAASSASAAATSETNAAASETAAAASESAAATSASNASTSETNAASSATAAAASATAAAASETNAAASETAAAASETAAAASESAAATSETNAATSETNAASSASTASTAATTATTQASAASSSATAAATSEANAATSETNAAASYDLFDDRFLGAKASAPTLDNDGDALVTGALYFDTTLDEMRVYDGTQWLSTAYNSANVAVTGGTIDNTVIGGTTPAAGSFTTGQFNTSLNVDGTVTADGLTVEGSAKVKTGTSGGSANVVADDFVVEASDNGGITISTPSTASGTIAFGDPNVAIQGRIAFSHVDNSMRFQTSNTTEAMRIDSSGNFLVGTTSMTASDTTGTGLMYANGIALRIKRESSGGGQPILDLNNTGSDDEIVRFRKDGSTVGSIGAAGGHTYITGASSGILFGVNAGIMPTNSSGTPVDNSKDIGAVSYRWDDIYATNGTIQTSDRNEKQDIRDITEAEARVAQACKGLLKAYRWKDAVAEKGDEARIHVGIIAQDLQDAFAAEGLDAGRYAMFTSSTWWEADEVIPAVEEVLDEDGNVVTEAQPERTVTNTYETLEEAPEGATKRTRLGVRYPELLAFIIGAL